MAALDLMPAASNLPAPIVCGGDLRNRVISSRRPVCSWSRNPRRSFDKVMQERKPGADQFAPGRESGCASRCAEPADRQRPLSILAALFGQSTPGVHVRGPLGAVRTDRLRSLIPRLVLRAGARGSDEARPE